MPTATMKKTPPTSADVVLGELPVLIVGAACHEAEVKPGEAVALKLEPANPHDPNAVRILNADFDQVGYLPRQVAAWLAPLIDAGKVRAETKVAASWGLRRASKPATARPAPASSSSSRPRSSPAPALTCWMELS